MTNIKAALEDYKKWVCAQEWYQVEEKDNYVVIRNAPSQKEIDLLVKEFGNLHKSYIDTLNDFGLSEFTYDYFQTRMLSPKEIIELYETVQGEMDFANEISDWLLEEKGLDFSKYIPVMAGKGTDGCWALLNISEDSKGEILYWDTDQAADVDAVFENIETFILQSISRAKQNNPLRLT